MRSIARLIVLATLAACAPAAPPEPGPALDPDPAVLPTPPDALAPSLAALRAAERAELTGRETGTMWTFENPPLAYWDSAYGFRPEADWLEHVRLSSVRFGDICSASFVSAEGLVMTNHHCARECGEAVSSPDADVIADGFLAERRKDELLCPDLGLDQLLDIRDVTERVRAAADPAAADTAAAAARRAEIETIEAECEEETGLECQVVSLYRGGQFQLYRYRRFEPVRLVFLPELQAGFYGGDPDNFTYPRHALDVAFVRAYEEDGTTPATTPHHFRWRPEGAAEGETVFVTGNPGSTSRLATVSQVLYERAFRHPFIVQLLAGQRDVLREITARGPQAERAVRDQLFSVENSLKAFSGQLEGLLDTLLIGQKVRWEEDFRDRMAENPELLDAYGDVWDRIADLQARKLMLAPRLNVNNVEFLGGPYEILAGELVRYVREAALPEEERSEGYVGEALAEVEDFLTRDTRPDREIAERLLALRLEIARRWLPADDPFLDASFEPEESPIEAARRLSRASRVADASFRLQIMRGGTDALEESPDPLLALVRRMVRTHRALEPAWEEATAAEETQETRLARALFGAFGTTLPPDATFTLRISDGEVRRYPYNGTFAAPFTTFHGMYDRAAAFEDEMPWTLPPTFRDAAARLDLSTRLNFVTTNDITGGNSGSPVIDRQARIVGVAFDGNIEQLSNQFLFRTGTPRTVAVHSAGILEALRVAYGADRLLAELLAGLPLPAEDPDPDAAPDRARTLEGERTPEPIPGTRD